MSLLVTPTSAESHPELTFRSTVIEPVDEDTFRVIGNLSINGVTNEVELPAELGGIEVKIGHRRRSRQGGLVLGILGLTGVSE
jgi:polyisoprenoid-binding protein YceI